MKVLSQSQASSYSEPLGFLGFADEGILQDPFELNEIDIPAADSDLQIAVFFGLVLRVEKRSCVEDMPMNFAGRELYITGIEHLVRVNTFEQIPPSPKFNRPNYCIVYKLSGSVRYTIGQTKLDSCPDGIVFLTKGIDYSVDMLEPGECIAINFHLLGSPELESFVIHPHNAPILKKLFMKLESLYTARMRNGEFKFLSVMYEIFSEIESYMRFRRISEVNIKKILRIFVLCKCNYLFEL